MKAFLLENIDHNKAEQNELCAAVHSFIAPVGTCGLYNSQLDYKW